MDKEKVVGWIKSIIKNNYNRINISQILVFSFKKNST